MLTKLHAPAPLDLQTCRIAGLSIAIRQHLFTVISEWAHSAPRLKPPTTPVNTDLETRVRSASRAMS